MLTAANRDPRKWPAPDRFDIRRDLRGHLGWGYGIHACVGRSLALLEAEALLKALIRHIERFEPAGEPEPWMTGSAMVRQNSRSAFMRPLRGAVDHC
jgi:cytochrome P450